HLSRASQGGDSWTYDSKPTGLAVIGLYLADVDTRAHLNSYRFDGIDDLLRASDGSCRTVECREEAITRGVHLNAPVSGKHCAHDRVMTGEKLPPCPVAESRSLRCGSDDVGEEHRREVSVELGLLTPKTRQEGLNGLDELLDVAEVGRILAPGELDESRSRNHVRDIARFADRSVGVSGALHRECGRGYGGQDGARV